MKFLVIQTRDIGDVVLSTALCNALKAAHPDSQVDMLTMSHCAGVVEGNPNVGSIVILDKDRRNQPGYMFQFLRRIRSDKYDVILNVQGQLIGLMTCLFSRGSRRIGFRKFPWSLFHSDNVKFRSQTEDSGHGRTSDDRFELLRPLCLTPKDRSYAIWLSDQERQRGKEILTAAGIDFNRPVIALGVNSRDDYKQWPLEHFAHNASWLISVYGAQVYVPFGPGEEDYSRGLKALMPEAQRGNVFDNVQTRSIRELAMVFSHCELYLGNDTGPRHIAQALDVPAMAVVSPASDKWGWIPWDHPRFRALDSGDAMGIPAKEWKNICDGLTWGVDDAQWFAKLDPEFVKTRVSSMIEELGLFSSSTVPGAPPPVSDR